MKRTRVLVQRKAPSGVTWEAQQGEEVPSGEEK